MSGDQPPLNVKTKDGKIIGLDVDLSRIMADAMGVKLKIENIPFHKLLPALQEGKIDMILSNMTMTQTRNLKVAFVGPYFISGKALLAKVDTIISFSGTKDIDKSDFSVAVLKGSTSHVFVKQFVPKAKHVITKSLDESLDLVIQGKVDAMVSDYPFCVVSAFRYKHKGLATVKTPINFEPIGIALPPNDPLLINWVENLLTTLKATNILMNLSKRWFEETSWLKRLPDTKDYTMLFQK
ncbi:MAG TPA: transporter substrate-binding domain-containing protein [Nitrospinota bacterium]|nr:transporter substrate-binding domain-containing protein [Nitrospinota bacterium]